MNAIPINKLCLQLQVYAEFLRGAIAEDPIQYTKLTKAPDLIVKCEEILADIKKCYEESLNEKTIE